MRLGILGGTFDPVHYGHLLLAESCREQARLDLVWFMPAAVPPHKQHEPLTAAVHRVEMLELAIGGHPSMAVSRLEIDHGGVSYTVDTLAAIRAERPDDELFFLMGSDSLYDLPKWREPGQICELATPLVVQRAGAPPPDFTCLADIVSMARLTAIASQTIRMPGMDLSSTDLRHRVARGRSIRFQTPRAVEKYIETQGLYKKA